jgi:hypothetical protein
MGKFHRIFTVGSFRTFVNYAGHNAQGFITRDNRTSFVRSYRSGYDVYIYDGSVIGLKMEEVV